MNRIYRWLAQRDIKAVLHSRLRNMSRPQEGRLTSTDINSIVERTWTLFDITLPEAPKFDKFGNRYLMEYGVLSLALYRSLCGAVADKAYATQLAADCIWKGYENALKIPLCFVEPIVHNREKRMDVLGRIVTRYVFGPPAYDVKTRYEDGTFYTDYYRCPVCDFFREQGEEELEFFRNTWCTFDFAAIEVLMRGPVKYERVHTLSSGDSVCDMRWSLLKDQPDN